MTISDRDVEEREYRPFSHIRDGYPRYLFTLDPLLQRREGVRHLNTIDFMKGDEDLLVGGIEAQLPSSLIRAEPPASKSSALLDNVPRGLERGDAGRA